MSLASETRFARRAPHRNRTIVSSDEENDDPATQRDISRSGEESDLIKPKTKGDYDVQNIANGPASPLELSQKESQCESSPSEPASDKSKTFEPEHALPTRHGPGRISCNVRASRRSELFIASQLQPPLATPRSSTPELKEEFQSLGAVKSPLCEITNTAVNEMAPVASAKQSLPDPPATHEEPTFSKPMDIVIRARAKATAVAPESCEAKSRLVITYLVLTNFKSYAGRQDVGPFHASFSSVVGPNGSGKSNVIDSLLFVFGFRASKMRQGKISALIHNSAAFPDLAFCEVEVHFQEVIDRPGGQHEVLPDSGLVVSRKAFKNNSSKYYIDGLESNFTSVTTLLRDRGIDLDHKRFLILQGEVESIAQMKPKAPTEHDDGLLEYLEDIIGTSKYKTPIEESVVEAERLNEVCVEKANRVAHVEKEKKGLEAKKDAALAYIKDENDLAVKQSALYQVFVVECHDNIQVAQESVSQMLAQLNEESEKHLGTEQEIEALKKECTAESKQFERMQQAVQAMQKQLSKVDKEAVKFEEKEKHLQAKIKKLEKAVSSSRFAVSEAAACIDRLTDDTKRNTDALSDVEKRLRAEEEDLVYIRDSLKDKTQGLSDQIGEKRKLLEPWIEQINEKRSNIAVAQSELAILKERGEAGGAALAAAKEKLTRLEDEKKNKHLELTKCQEQISSLEEESGRLRATVDKLTGIEPDRRAQLSVARQRADEAKASLSKTQTQGNVMAGLKRLKDSGRIRGFHGRLGDLGIIDAKYDVAISTACPALDNMVVDSVEVGQQCIEHLRKNSLGRANFILLNRLGHRDLSAISTPEGVPRLFDLVSSKDDIFRPAFYSVLQNTLVAKDLDQANRIAYGSKRWRVVTLDGQLIDKSGTMSGGGTRIAKGSMSSKLMVDTTKEQVHALEAEQEKLEQEFMEMQKERQAAESSLKSLEETLPTLATKSQKCSLELESLDRNILDANRRYSELSKKKETPGLDSNEIRNLQTTILNAENEIKVSENNAAGLEAEVQALQDKIMEIGGVKLRAQKAKVDGLSQQMVALTEEMSGSEVSRAKTEKQKHKHEKSIAEAEKELEALAIELQRVKEEGESQAKSSSGSRKEAEEAQEVLDTKREAVEALKAAMDEKMALINEARGNELEMRNQLEEHQKTLSENEKRLKYWEEKLKKLETQDFSDLGEEVGKHEFAVYSRDELADFNKEMLKAEIAILEEKIANVNVELGVLSEYRRRVEEHEARNGDLTEAISTRDTAKRHCEELRRLRLEGFMEGFSAISLRLKEMYQMITMGGNAELELVDSLDPFSEGILFSVMPPKKSWKNISNLSGGEKTLSSLALVFALHHYKPTPLYVMDEIDAALDFRNVSIVASYIKERTKNAQFIVISLRNNMFELASRLIGVYKVNHMTKSVTVDNRDYITREP